MTLVLIATAASEAQTIPLVDHHQHLLDAETVALVTQNANPAAVRIDPISAKDLVALLDQAGIRSALVMSVAYTWANPSRHVENEYERVRAINDWTSRQVAEYPNRLRGFCSVNPLRAWALDEI